MTNTKQAAKYRIQTTMGAGWQSFGEANSAEEVAERIHIARRTGYRTQVLDRNGERLSLTYDRAGKAQLVTIPD